MTDTWQKLGDVAQRVVDKLDVERIGIADDRGRIDRERWLPLRKQDVTASDVGAVMGVNPYRSPAQVYYEKLGTVPGLSDNDMLRQGRWFEPAIMVALEETYPDWHVTKAMQYMRAPALRIGATPDFMAIDPTRDGYGSVQGKVVEKPIFEANWYDGDDLSPPLSYQLQTLVEAKLTGANWAALAVLVHAAFGKSELQIIPVEIHEGAWQRIVSKVGEFWRDVGAGTEPQFDPACDAELLKTLFPKDDGLTIDLSDVPGIVGMVDAYEDAGSQAKHLKEQRDELSTRLKAMLGPHTYGRIEDGRTISWKLQHRSAYSVPEGEHRVLRISKGRSRRERAA